MSTDINTWIIGYLKKSGGRADLSEIARAGEAAGLNKMRVLVAAQDLVGTSTENTDEGGSYGTVYVVLDSFALGRFIVDHLAANGGRASVASVKAAAEQAGHDSASVYRVAGRLDDVSVTADDMLVLDEPKPEPKVEPKPEPVKTLNLSDRARTVLISTVRRGPYGGAHVVGTTSAAAFSELANLGLIEEKDGRVNFVSPVDSEIPDAIREQVIKASSAVVETLTERANTLADLRRSMGAEAVDWATSRLNGILIHHVDKGWALIGGAPRKTPEQVQASRAARPTAAKAGVVETPVETPAVKTAVQTAVQTDKLDVIAANTGSMVEGLSALYALIGTAVKGDDLTEGVRIVAGRTPTVEAVARRIAVLLRTHGPLTRHQIKDRLSSAQKAKRDAAVQLGVDSGAFKRELASRYSLQNPAALGLTEDQLDVEVQRIKRRAAARTGSSS